MTIDHAIARIEGDQPWCCDDDREAMLTLARFARDHGGPKLQPPQYDIFYIAQANTLKWKRRDEGRENAVRPIYLDLVSETKRRVNFIRWAEQARCNDWRNYISHQSELNRKFLETGCGSNYERPEYGEANNAMLRHLRSLAR
jgi:hypothetical protein